MTNPGIRQRDLIALTDQQLILRSYRQREDGDRTKAKRDYRLALDAEMLKRGLITKGAA